MMFRGRREYINLTQSTAYTIVTIVYAVLCVKLVYSLQPLTIVKTIAIVQNIILNLAVDST